jgi:hypothetical protein
MMWCLIKHRTTLPFNGILAEHSVEYCGCQNVMDVSGTTGGSVGEPVSNVDNGQDKIMLQLGYPQQYK